MSDEPLDSTPWREQLRQASTLARIGLYCVAFVVLPVIASLIGTYVECEGTCSGDGDDAILGILAGLATLLFLAVTIVVLETVFAVRRHRQRVSPRS